MKTSIKTLSTICAVVISLTVNAQHRSRGNDPAPQNNTYDKHIYASSGNQRHKHHNNHNNHHGNWGGGISVTIGNNPWGYGNYYGNPYANGYNNYHNIKKAARNSIRQSANVIGDALQYSDWNDMYSPWLAKAIRHQQYAKQLYFWGDYAGALNHAERAGFLAWNTLSYFNNYDSNLGGNYPNSYSDPNNPYYKKNVTPLDNSGSIPNDDDSDFGYKKGDSNVKSNEKTDTNINTERKMAKEDIDNTLPQSKVSDRELLKTSAKDLDVQ